ncbi:MAG TPA: methionine--tRNA ligase, partial [Bacteroidetes bacterium]|nr:methionine--tRNA ligase [Bacteroidota bacterium]
MSETKKILVTSALPYANGPIHLGHLAGAYLPADIYVRYQKLMKNDVIFICGTDEHGVPITIAAEKKHTTPQEIVDYYYVNHKVSFEGFGIHFDNFSRTSLKTHHRTSQEFFLRLYRKKLLLTHTSEQFYCIQCRRFLADRYVVGTCPTCGNPDARGDQCEKCGKWLEPTQLIEPKCAVCGTQPILKQTTQWFLPLARFQDQISAWIDSKKNWRDNVKNFCRGWFQEGLEDRAVTRDLDWGVPVPLKNHGGKVLYVWFEAPIGYISSTKEWALKMGQPDRWKDYWLDPKTKLVHFIGKDNIVFHAIVWPAMLMGRGEYILPTDIPANEFLNLEGRKLSTSKNYAVWLDDYLRKFPPDPLRYTLAANAPESKDSDFSWKDFQSRNNNELADILGNFINRTLSFVERYFEGRVPAPGAFDPLDEELVKFLMKAPEKIGRLFENYEVRAATRDLMEFSRFANKYFNDQEPWKTRNNNTEKCKTTLYLCLELGRALAILWYPIIPFSAEKIWRMLNLSGTVQDQEWRSAARLSLRPGHRLGNSSILFKKIEDSVIERESARLAAIAAGQTSPQPKKKPEIRPDAQKTADLKAGKDKTMDKLSIDVFKKIDLRTAKILAAEPVEGTDRLVTMQVDLGTETRQIVAGIA